MHLKRVALVASVSVILTACAPRGAMEPNSHTFRTKFFRIATNFLVHPPRVDGAFPEAKAGCAVASRWLGSHLKVS